MDVDKLSGQANSKVEAGAVVLVTGSDASKVRQAAFSLASKGVAAALVLARDSQLSHFEEAGKQLPKISERLAEDSADDMMFNALALNRDAFHALAQTPEGAMVHFEA